VVVVVVVVVAAAAAAALAVVVLRAYFHAISIGLLWHAASGLEKGKEYEFRVKAKNRAGLGEPSQPSETVTPKAKAS